MQDGQAERRGLSPPARQVGNPGLPANREWGSEPGAPTLFRASRPSAHAPCARCLRGHCRRLPCGPSVWAQALCNPTLSGCCEAPSSQHPCILGAS